jgi:drug/metabolite transporter (DMT)-like permease
MLAILLVLWSSNFLFARFALREMPVALVVGLRYVVSALCMAPVALLGRRDPVWTRNALKWRDTPALLAVGLLGLVGNQVLFVIGLSMTSVAHASVITALSPVLVLVGAFAIGLEPVTRGRVLGLLLAGCGVVVLQFSRGSSGPAGGGATFRGDAVMLVSVVFFAGFNLWGKPLAERYGSMKMNAVSYASAGMLALPLVASHWTAGAHSSRLAWIGVTYMGACSSVLGYLIYGYALRHLPASRVAVVVYLQPVLASLMAIPVLGERPGIGFLPASALVLGGVYTVEKMAGRALDPRHSPPDLG